MSVRVYCDQNFLINIGREQESYIKELMVLISKGQIHPVLSPWHWVEMAQGDNDAASLALADFADYLEPVWIRERRSLQRHEVEESFFSWLKVSYARPAPLTTRAGIIADISQYPVERTSSMTSRDFVGYLRAQPAAMAHIANSYTKNLQAVGWIRKARRDGKLTPDAQKRVDRIFVGMLLPGSTPTGIQIDRSTQGRFLDEFDIQSCPTIATEFATSEYGWESTYPFNWRTHIDRLHAICAIPYTELVATDDAELARTIESVKPHLRFPCASPISKANFDKAYAL